MIRYVKGWVACIERTDGERFANGSRYLYCEPFSTERKARWWAAAFKPQAKLIRVECNDVPAERIVD